MTHFDSLEACAAALEGCRRQLDVIGWQLTFLVVGVCLLTLATLRRGRQ